MSIQTSAPKVGFVSLGCPNDYVNIPDLIDVRCVR